MKKHLSILILLTAMTTQSVRAQYFTLRASGGYAFPGFIKSEPIIGPKIDPFSPDKDGLVPMANINDSVPYTQSVYGSYGKGGNFTFAFGYMINPYIGVEMGVSYLKSATITADQTKGLTIQTGFGNPPQFSFVGSYMKAHIETNAFGVSLMPSIILQGAKPGWKVYPYGRFGISMPVFGGLTHTVSIDVPDTTFLQLIKGDPYYLGKHVDVELKTEGTVSVGFNGALGVAYKPLPYLAITAEVNGQYLVTRAKSAEITKWETDGKDRLADRGVYRTHFNFVDKLDENSNNEDYNKTGTDKTKAKDDLRPSGPFNNIGFNIGVTFMLSKEILGKKKEDKKK
ncbi:MAG: outer membrane beta-barrel protein [Chitinophagales bacterium]